MNTWSPGVRHLIDRAWATRRAHLRAHLPTPTFVVSEEVYEHLRREMRTEYGAPTVFADIGPSGATQEVIMEEETLKRGARLFGCPLLVVPNDAVRLELT